MKRAIILTALRLERDAVLEHLSGVSEITHDRGTIYRSGRFEDWTVSVAEIGPGNPSAAAETERAIGYFSPNVVVFAGVAGGIKDVSLGDVVAATKVYGFESGKAEREFRPRPEVANATYSLEQRAKAEAGSTKWRDRIANSENRSPSAFVEPIAAGEKVVADTQSDVFSFIRKQYSDAVAIEMEGFGCLLACHMNSQVDAIVVRGISDRIDSKEESDSDGWQPIAAAHAAAFTFELLSNYQVSFRLPNADPVPMPSPTDISPPAPPTESNATVRADNQNELDQPPTASSRLPRGDSYSNLSDPILSAHRLSELLGVSSSMVLASANSGDPPPLPTPRLSRATMFPSISRKFDSASVVAITGYPESGKTVAMTEFAIAHPGDVFWFSVPRSVDVPDAWFSILCLAIAEYVGEQSFSTADIRHHLAGRQEPLLIVIDDAQHCHDIKALSFLRESAEASTHISVILIGTDDPAFTSMIRSSGIAEERLPGLTSSEAQSLMEMTGAELSSHQLEALDILRSRVDGHLGMLRLSRNTILAIETEGQRDEYIREVLTRLGAGLDSLQAAMIERLRSQLHENECELCRRVSLVLGSFPRHVGAKLWAIGRSDDTFAKTWNGCVTRVLENRSSGKYGLPDLYQDGFHQEIGDQERPLWHGAIAEAYAEQIKQSGDAMDIYYAVFHRLLSGDVASAMESATMYLALVNGPNSRAAQAFLIRHFEMWLSSSAGNETIAATTRIRWHAIRASVQGDLKASENANAAILDLQTALKSAAGSEVAPEAILLGWTVILLHASASGQPELALLAANQLRDVPSIPVDRLPELEREACVLLAYLKSNSSPLQYLLDTMEARKPESSRLSSLWNSQQGYQFWRGVTATIYSRRDDTAGRVSDPETLANDIQRLVERCRDVGESSIACLAQCALVTLAIDLLRDFNRACDVSKDMIDHLDKASDANLLAYAYDTHGDALRCAGRDEEAIEAYSLALEIWPEYDTWDRPETLLMLGISNAKRGRFLEGAEAAQAAAALYLHPNENVEILESGTTVARYLLEAASYYIHAREYGKACRSLIVVHALLVSEHRHNPEWVALGQLGWSIANRFEPAPENPQPPAPGFTLAIDVRSIEFENMAEFAPTMMLARACAAVGRPHRAMMYAEFALSECEDSDLRVQIGIMAHGFAIEAHDVVAATRFARIGSEWLSIAPASAPVDAHDFVFDHLIGRTVQSASSRPEEVNVLQEAVKEAVKDAEISNPAIQLLRQTLDAYRIGMLEDDDSGFREAFNTAIDNGALWVARDIAWHWCFRFTRGREVREDDFLFWHWRLAWLSQEIGGHDPAYLASVVEQQRNTWNSIPEDFRSERIRRILPFLEEDATSAEESIAKLVERLSIAASGNMSITDASNEIASQLRHTRARTALDVALDALYVRFLTLVLSPGAPEFLQTLQVDISKIIASLPVAEDAYAETLEKFDELKALTDTLQTESPSTTAFKALRRAHSRISELSPNSAAQVYIWMRHFMQYAPDDFGYQRINGVLTSAEVAELLGQEDLLPQLRIRLGVCHFSAKAAVANQRLGQALSEIQTQQTMQSPVTYSAMSGSENERDSAIDEIVKQLQMLETEAREADLQGEVWSCCFELGNVRRLAGSVLLLLAQDDSARERWLNPSLADFQRAAEAAEPLDSPRLVELGLKAAFTGQGLAHAINADAALPAFTGTIERIRETGEYGELIRSLEPLAEDDLLGIQSSDAAETPWPDDEDAIQHYTDHIMQSGGWPHDRRQFVEDDVRKVTRTKREQVEYCRHLQPLQNLEHTQSPDTAYTTPTRYVCSCAIFDRETSIELEDIDTVIDAMKRVYCNSCDRRAPGNL